MMYTVVYRAHSIVTVAAIATQEIEKTTYIFCIDCFAQSCHRARARIEGRVFGLRSSVSGAVSCHFRSGELHIRQHLHSLERL